MKYFKRKLYFQIDPVTSEGITYSEILQNSVQLADSLRKHGIKRDDVITIISENSLDYVLPVLAGMLVAAVVNPINPAYISSKYNSYIL